MAKLPITIYKEILAKQKELFESGERDGTIPIDLAYYYFDMAGYRRSTANKWLLNWGTCKALKFDTDKQGRTIRLGEFYDCTPEECLNGVWLNVKEVILPNMERCKL